MPASSKRLNELMMMMVEHIKSWNFSLLLWTTTQIEWALLPPQAAFHFLRETNLKMIFDTYTGFWSQFYTPIDTHLYTNTSKPRPATPQCDLFRDLLIELTHDHLIYSLFSKINCGHFFEVPLTLLHITHSLSLSSIYLIFLSFNCNLTRKKLNQPDFISYLMKCLFN